MTKQLQMVAKWETEKEEKAKRHQLMKAHGCDELQAVHLVAEEIAKKRGVVQ